MKLRTCAPLLLLPALWGAACKSPVDDPGSTLPGKCESESPVVAPQKTDILFVIDNSSSMAEEQEGIAQELPAFVEALEAGGGLAQDFRVGVITTSVYRRVLFQGQDQVRYYEGESGRLQAVPDTGGQPTDERFIEGTDPFLVEKFRRLVEQGTEGSGQETPFEAVRLAVTEPLATTPISEGGNSGFLRDGARLLVVVVTDEEDCSSTQRPPPVVLTEETSVDHCTQQGDKLTSVDEYFSLFQGLHDSTGASREVLWATIGPVALTDKQAGLVQDVTSEGTFVRNVDCPTSNGPGIRQRAMTEKFDQDLQNLDSICKAGYRDTLLRIAELATVAQSIDVVNLPDARLAQVELTRADGTVERCSVAAGDLRYEPSGEERSARLYFLGSCLRRADDTKVEVKVLCAG
ncbi:vWA domain-containing protein [Pyxidicoccus sp. 3LFB2]